MSVTMTQTVMDQINIISNRPQYRTSRSTKTRRFPAAQLCRKGSSDLLSWVTASTFSSLIGSQGRRGLLAVSVYAAVAVLCIEATVLLLVVGSRPSLPPGLVFLLGCAVASLVLVATISRPRRPEPAT